MDKLRTLLSGRTGMVLIVALSIAFGMSLAVNLFGRDTAYAVDQQTVAKQQRAALYELQTAFTSLADEILPSVVSITSTRTVETGSSIPGLDDFFKNFPFPFSTPETPDTPRPRKTESYGTGVIVRSDGYILTNEHVIAGADKVTVTLSDGREFQGTVTSDPRSDLAVVKIDAKNLSAANLGDSSKVKVGSWAIAIGSPFGLDQTVTVGVISATGRQATAPDGSGFYPNLIQTDASINPGNSGGPLIDIDGKVIGINTLIRSSMGGGNIGIGFAIPANTAKFVLDQLIAHGKVTRGYLGMVPEDLTPKVAERLGVKEGVLVRSVEVGSPADKGGLQVEDVIVQFDGKKIGSEIQFRDVVAATQPNKKVNVMVVRDGERKTLHMTLGEAPEVEVASETPAESTDKLGFSVANVTQELREKYDYDAGTKGIIVTAVAPGSSAARVGLEPGQIVVRANDKNVKSVAEFEAATKDLKSGDTLRMIVQSKQRRALVQFTID